MAVATDRESGIFIGGESAEPASGLAGGAVPDGPAQQSGFGRELALATLDRCLETKSVVVSTGARPINPLGL